MQVTWVHGKGARDTELSFDDFEDVVDEMDAEVGFDETGRSSGRPRGASR